MQVSEAIKKRRSIRRFIDKEVREDAVEKLIEAIRWAPSAGNLQSRKFYFVYNKEIKERLAIAALRQMFIATATLVIVACGNYRRIRPYGGRGEELYVIQDVAVAVENLMLQACDLGLGTVWVGAFNEKEVARILGLPDYLRPMAIIPVGYPTHYPMPPIRLERDEIIEIVR